MVSHLWLLQLCSSPQQALLRFHSVSSSGSVTSLFPDSVQGTAFTNSTTSKATQTSSSFSSETTAGPSLTRSCGFWLPNEIFLNSWWTQHATFTVSICFLQQEYQLKFHVRLQPKWTATSNTTTPSSWPTRPLAMVESQPPTPLWEATTREK